ncbi:MAG: HEAT repeat domain-containing protein [Roseibacillus sp.]|nr:HEAT repeat domain-containing protein [Roseibacillus sp.]
MNAPNRLAGLLLLTSLLTVTTVVSEVDKDALPKVDAGLVINFFVKEPHIINPSSLCFDKKGRLFVGAGPQYRGPKEDSPTDYIKILIDDDGDGVAETVKTFAEGLNCVQSMAWKGDELWVANAPELTVLRDTDGDDVADEYQVIYTGLNNLRHSLHGLNWGPDGWLYMTIGNTWMKEHAPKPFRELQGLTSKDETEYPLTKVYTKDTYPKSYHPMNKRETEGGIFRCRPGGYDLELFARGMRNPWDICMDSGFNWLGTDNDPGQPAERIFMPVPYGHYSMRHAWMFDWMGDHLSIAPSSDLFPGVSGSGTGVVYYHSTHLPEKYRHRYLIADWTNNCIFLYEPKWEGSLQLPAVQKRKIVDGGATQAGDLGYKGAKGRALFRPTDIEVGPDGALYMAGWGSVYGTDYVPKEQWTPQENAKYQGRVFRLRHQQEMLIPRSAWDPAKRSRDLDAWSFAELIDDIGSQVQVWRVDAQDEIIRRGKRVREELLHALDLGKLTESQATWTVWALGRIDAKLGIPGDVIALALGERKNTLNLRVQAARILGETEPKGAISVLIRLLTDREPRVRLAAIQALGRTGWGEQSPSILDALAGETDRLTLYTAWQVLRRQRPAEARKALLKDTRGGIRLMAALSLMEEKRATPSEIYPLLEDRDERVRGVASDWLQKTGARKARTTITATEINFRTQSKITLKTSDSFQVRYTLDGSTPHAQSQPSTRELVLTASTTIKAAAFDGANQVSNLETLSVHKITESEWGDRLFVRKITAQGAKDRYQVVDDGLQPGVLIYVGGSTETIVHLPDSVAGATLLRTSPADAKNSKRNFLSFEVNLPATVYVASSTKGDAPPWLKDGFQKTDLLVSTSTSDEFSIFKKDVERGQVVLGGNAGSKMYHVYLTKQGIRKANIASVTNALPKANPEHGQEIFFGRGTCFACHQVGGKGVVLGPDLKAIYKRQDLNYVITSILEPDAYIVEGFQQTSLKMKDGRELFGMIQEETAQSLKIYLPTGERVVVNPKDITKRSDAKHSGMPASFAYTLSPQDIADLSAWIMSLK